MTNNMDKPKQAPPRPAPTVTTYHDAEDMTFGRWLARYSYRLAYLVCKVAIFGLAIWRDLPLIAFLAVVSMMLIVLDWGESEFRNP